MGPSSTSSVIAVARERIRLRHYSPNTEKSYIGWMCRYIDFCGGRHPRELGAAEIMAFLTHLALDRDVVASTQNQALHALQFLYCNVLEIDLPLGGQVVRARRPKRLPVVLTRDEVRRVLSGLRGTSRLMVGLLYGSGLRSSEVLQLRVKDLDLDRREITVRGGKASKDRVTVVPAELVAPLRRHLDRLAAWFERERRAGAPGAHVPDSSQGIGSGTAITLGWQWVFPARAMHRDPHDGVMVRNHVHHRSLQRAVHAAVQRAGIGKPVGCHTFRHCFATHLLESGCSIRAVQELLGHSHVKTTQVYTHVLNRGGQGAMSPLDDLF